MPKNYRDLYPSKFLKPVDLEDGPDTIATIKRVALERLGTGPDANDRLVLYFREPLKPLPMNLTMGKAVERISGTADYEAWPGARVALFVTTIDAFGETHQVIRIRAPREPRGAPQRKAAPRDDLDDIMQPLDAGLESDT